MNKFFNNTLLVLFTFAAFSNLYGQADNDDDIFDNHGVKIIIPNFAILDIEPESTTFDLEADEALEAGTAITFANAVNNELWLNYSSIIASGSLRKVTVQLDAAVPDGLVLEVTASADSNTGAGTRGGVSGSAVTLSTTAADIVTGIGSCYTGDGISNGHNLSYALSADVANYGDIVSTVGTTINVTYTIVTQ